ncbi:MAG: hypothetical protein WB678_06295 [Stellaceae bacterium]
MRAANPAASNNCVLFRGEADGRDPVWSDLKILAAKDHAFESGLGDEQAIERVGMMARQFRRMLGVLAGDRDQLKPVSDDRLDDPLGKAELSDRALDADFPNRGRADEYLVGRIGDGVPQRAGDHLRLTVPPQENVRVE